MLTLDRLGPSFGAVVHHLSLGSLDDDQVAAVRAAPVEHKVLFFRGQDLDDAGQVELGRRLGELTAGHPVATSIEVEQPEIYNIDSADQEFSFSDVWHTDVTFMERSPLGSILRAMRLPSYGGDTSWVDSQLAYESLSAPVRDLVDGLDAVHDGNREWGAYLRRRGGVGNVWDGAAVTELPPVVHPVVRVHPESGRRAAASDERPRCPVQRQPVPGLQRRGPAGGPGLGDPPHGHPGPAQHRRHPDRRRLGQGRGGPPRATSPPYDVC